MEVFGTLFLLQEQFSFTNTANHILIHHSTPIKFPNTAKVINYHSCTKDLSHMQKMQQRSTLECTQVITNKSDMFNPLGYETT